MAKTKAQKLKEYSKKLKATIKKGVVAPKKKKKTKKKKGGKLGLTIKGKY